MRAAEGPPRSGLVVAPRAKLTWSVPVRVPVDVDEAGNVVEWLEVDPVIAAHRADRGVPRLPLENYPVEQLQQLPYRNL